MTHLEKWELLCVEMESRYPVLASVWTHAPEKFGSGWAAECVQCLETLYGDVTPRLSAQFTALLDGYAEFANDSMRNQVFYEKTGHYRANSHEQVSRDCYHNADFMNLRYLPGMVISHFVWPQHYYMQKSFRELLLPRVGHSKLFFEVGVGCGLYSKITLDTFPDIYGVGFDISNFSLEFTGELISAFGHRDRYQLENRDIRFEYQTQCDFLICQEVLEHIEKPGEFCEWLHNLVKPSGYAYITAALNAAHSDHIYLFHSPNELENILREAGFQLLHGQEEFAPSLKGRNLTPSLSGFLCQRIK
jgi:SAM-dependent methyltransferase